MTTTLFKRSPRMPVALGAAVLVAGFASMDVAYAADSMANTAKVPSADKKFMDKAAIGGMTEVELGKLAEKNAADPSVKQFGQRMVTDHSKANDELKGVASAQGVDLPTALDSKHQKTVDKMAKLSGKDFDKAYMKDMVSDHKEDVSDFKKEANSGKDQKVKDFAAKTLPTLEEHLKMAQDTHDKVK